VNKVFLGCQKCQLIEGNKCFRDYYIPPSVGGLMRLDVSEPVLVAGHWLGRINLRLALQSAFLQSASTCSL